MSDDIVARIREAFGHDTFWDTDAPPLLEDAVAEIERLRAGWIPVSERLPPPPASEWEDGVRVLAWSKGNGIDPAWFYRDSEYGDRWSWDSTTQPTHWMPLPEPPSAL